MRKFERFILGREEIAVRKFISEASKRDLKSRLPLAQEIAKSVRSKNPFKRFEAFLAIDHIRREFAQPDDHDSGNAQILNHLQGLGVIRELIPERYRRKTPRI